MLVGKRIKIARIETDVSQEALAHALDVSQKVEYDYATIRAMLDNLSITLQMSASVDTAAANRAMLALFDAVEFDGKSIVRVVWRAPFESFNQS